MDTFDVDDTATLSATFYVDDVPTDPTTVTLRVKDPAGTITTPTPTSTVEGTWEYEQALPLPGVWRWEFKGIGNADGVQGGALRVRVSLLDADSPATFVTPDDIETALGRVMTPDEYERADQLITQLVRLMERRLNRDLYARTIVNEPVCVPALGIPYLRHGPVLTVYELAYANTGASLSFDSFDPWSALLPGYDYLVSYTTDPSAAGELDDVRAVVVDAVTRTLLMPAVAASGAIKSYAVEGTSITYGSSGAGTAEGRITVGDMQGIGRLRRPVLIESGGRRGGGLMGGGRTGIGYPW